MKRRILLISAAVLLVAVLAFGQNVANYMEQGGSVWNIGSGGTLKVLSGGLLQFGTTASVAVMAGGGTSASPATTATADKNFLAFFTQSTATSGTSRGLYLKHFLADTTPSGETLRALTEVDTAGATDAHGAHVGIQFGANGTVAGETAALRSTFAVPSKTLGGTNGSLYTEVWADGTSSDWSNGQFQRYVYGGNATGITALDLTTALFSIEGGTIGTAGQGHLVNAISGDKAVTHLAKIRINGETYWLMLRNAE